jgi:hypothetical protein
VLVVKEPMVRDMMVVMDMNGVMVHHLAVAEEPVQLELMLLTIKVVLVELDYLQQY